MPPEKLCCCLDDEDLLVSIAIATARVDGLDDPEDIALRNVLRKQLLPIFEQCAECRQRAISLMSMVKSNEFVFEEAA